MAHTRLFVLILLAGLAACDSSGGGKDGIPDSIGPINCAGLTGATATGNVACTAGTCGVDFHQAAVDHDLRTYAVLTMTSNTSGSVSIRATAQEGVTYPAGTPAAVVYGIDRTEGNTIGNTVRITTYNDGALQESEQGGTTNGTGGGDEDAGRHAINTSLPFDAIELNYVQSGGTAGLEVQVYEFCTSTN